MPPENDNLIQEDEMFILSFDPGKEPVAADIAAARGDIPDESTLDKPVELLLDEDAGKLSLDDLKKGLEEKEEEVKEEAAVEETTESTAEPDVDLEEKKDTPPGAIPYSRFAEKVSEVAQLRQKIAELEAGGGQHQQQRQPEQEAQPEFDLAGKYKEYADLVADGESAAAANVMMEIDTFKEQKAEQRVLRSIEQREVRGKAQAVVDQILDEHGEWFDDPINQETFNATKMALMNRGKSLHDALVETKRRFFGDPAAAEKKAEQEKLPTDDANLQAKKEAQTKKTVEKNAAASNQQPSALDGGRGNRAAPQQKPNALAFSDKEYVGMSEREKRIARGDLVV